MGEASSILLSLQLSLCSLIVSEWCILKWCKPNYHYCCNYRYFHRCCFCDHYFHCTTVLAMGSRVAANFVFLPNIVTVSVPASVPAQAGGVVHIPSLFTFLLPLPGPLWLEKHRKCKFCSAIINFVVALPNVYLLFYLALWRDGTVVDHFIAHCGKYRSRFINLMIWDQHSSNWMEYLYMFMQLHEIMKLYAIFRYFYFLPWKFPKKSISNV